jgi:hypothetical protein
VGPATMPDDAGTIRSAVSGEESGGWADCGASGSAPENAAKVRPCSSVAREPTLAGVLTEIEAALVVLESGEASAAAGQMRSLAVALRQANRCPMPQSSRTGKGCPTLCAPCCRSTTGNGVALLQRLE